MAKSRHEDEKLSAVPEGKTGAGAGTGRGSSVSRVNDELEVGYDRDFEARWWRIEVGIWILLVTVIVCGAAGVFGRGPLAHHGLSTPDQQLQVRFERVARYKTPDVMTIRIGPKVFRDGKAYLWMNRAVIEKMGTQRIIPEPLMSTPGMSGMGYVFPVENPNDSIVISIAQEPSAPGIFHEEVRTDKDHDLFMSAVTLP